MAVEVQTYKFKSSRKTRLIDHPNFSSLLCCFTYLQLIFLVYHGSVTRLTVTGYELSQFLSPPVQLPLVSWSRVEASQSRLEFESCNNSPKSPAGCA